MRLYNITPAMLLLLFFTACGAQSEPPQTEIESALQDSTPEVSAPDTALQEDAAELSSDTITDFSSETVGGEPTSFLPAVGYWTIAVDGDNPVLFLDGSRWEQGQASANIAEHARELYGDRYSEFLDNVQAFAYYPFAVARDVDEFTDGEISMRFKTISGRIDQNAGILFDLKPNGDYYTIRASSLENNLVLWRVVSGRRSSVEWVRNVPASTGEWHELKLTVNGRDIQGYLDGQLTLEYTLEEPVSGKVGIWSKADSSVDFDDFRVVPAETDQPTTEVQTS